jgi:hypothetical protein
LIACLRRVDCGDPVDSVLRDYPEDAGWLREHLSVSDALQMTDGPSAEKKNRARESLLSAVAHSDRPAKGATRLRFGFALAPTALMVFICLALTAGAAAASGVNLRSVVRDVVDSLVEPLPLAAPPPISAEGPQGLIGLDSEEGAAGDDPARDERADLQPNEGGVDGDGTTLSDAPRDGASDNTNLPVEGGPFDETNRPGNKPPADKPIANDPTRAENHGGDHGNRPDENGPPAQTPSPSDPPDGHGHAGCDGHGDHGDEGQPGEDESNGNGPDTGELSSSNRNPSNGANGVGPNHEGREGSRGSNPNSNGQADEGEAK